MRGRASDTASADEPSQREGSTRAERCLRVRPRAVRLDPRARLPAQPVLRRVPYDRRRRSEWPASSQSSSLRRGRLRREATPIRRARVPSDLLHRTERRGIADQGGYESASALGGASASAESWRMLAGSARSGAELSLERRTTRAPAFGHGAWRVAFLREIADVPRERVADRMWAIVRQALAVVRRLADTARTRASGVLRSPRGAATGQCAQRDVGCRRVVLRFPASCIA
jgi:hypothetical protein